ncbi:MAG: hypothetical protein ABJF23_02915 [Bryobacteraceae bacterium]
MIQIEIENSTTFRRRIFLHASRVTAREPIPLALTAWKYFDLGPGAGIGTVDGDFQLSVHVSSIVHGVDYRTVFSEAGFGDAFRVEFADGIPVLSRSQTDGEGLDVVNGTTGPQASALAVTLYRDYAPLLQREVPVNGHEQFVFPAELFCYASMPFSGETEALALEPTIGRLDLREAGNLRLGLVPAGSGIQWKVNGKASDVS